MTKKYTEDEVEEMREIHGQMEDLLCKIQEITRGDGHTEAYFTDQLENLITGGNPYDENFESVIKMMVKSCEPETALRMLLRERTRKIVKDCLAEGMLEFDYEEVAETVAEDDAQERFNDEEGPLSWVRTEVVDVLFEMKGEIEAAYNGAWHRTNVVQKEIKNGE